MSVVLLDLGPLAGHFRRMLGTHWSWCRQNGVPWPSALDEIGQLLASGGQERTALAVEDGVDDGGAVLLLDFDETARRLGVSARTVRRLTAAGRLPVVAIGSARRVRVSDLADFVEHLTERTPA